MLSLIGFILMNLNLGYFLFVFLIVIFNIGCFFNK